MLEINLDKKEKYILGCSFGPDSMALFHLLYNNGYNFVVCNIDYNYLCEKSDKVIQIEKQCVQTVRRALYIVAHRFCYDVALRAHIAVAKGNDDIFHSSRFYRGYAQNG